MAEPGKQVAKKTPARKAAKRAAPAASSTRSRGAARTAAQPQQVEEEAAAAAKPRRRPAADRPAARAAAALRGEPAAAPDAEEPAAAPALKTTKVPFLGRMLEVRMATDEQLIMYRRVSREFALLARDGREANLPMEEALKYLDRAVRTVQTVLVHPDDREWLEDQLMDGKATLDQCTDLMRAAIRQVAEANMTREEKRANARLLAELED